MMLKDAMSVISSLLFLMVISPLCIYCQKIYRRDLPGKSQNIDEIEVKMLGFVAEELHRGQST